MYKINPFIITNYDEYSVIQNAKIVSIVKDKEEIELLKWIDKNNIYDLKEEDIHIFSKTNTQEIIKDFLELYIIKIQNKNNAIFKDIHILSNDYIFLNSMEFNMQGIEYDIYYHMLDKDIQNTNFDYPQSLYLIFINPFNYSYFTKLIDIIIEKNILCRIAVYYANMICISNYYKSEWKNPCPKCFMSNLEASIRSIGQHDNSTTFVNLIDLIYREHMDFEIEYTFNNKSIMKLVNILISQINNISNSLLNNVTYIYLQSDVIKIDQSMYWELCDCYE